MVLGSVSDHKLSALQVVGHVKRNGARGTAGAQKQHVHSFKRLYKSSLPSRLRCQNAFDEAVAVGIIADELTLRVPYDGINGSNTRRARIEVVQEVHDGEFVRNSDVHAHETMAVPQNGNETVETGRIDVKGQVDCTYTQMSEGRVPQGRALRIVRRCITDNAGYAPVADGIVVEMVVDAVLNSREVAVDSHGVPCEAQELHAHSELATKRIDPRESTNELV